MLRENRWFDRVYKNIANNDTKANEKKKLQRGPTIKLIENPSH